MHAQGISLPAQVFALIDISGGPDACHPISGRSNGKGYAQVMVDGRRYSAHRYVFRTLVGPIPPRFDIDHTCHNRDSTCRGGRNCPHRRCCNPRHLRAVPHGTNVNAIRGRLLVCRRGHPWNAENTRVRADGYRWCAACDRERHQSSRTAFQLPLHASH